MATDRGSSKHGPIVDENMENEANGYVHAGHDTRAEEWRSAEPPTGDPAPLLVSDRRGTPDGMSATDVEDRSELASWLGRAAFPGNRDELVSRLREENAPDHVLSEVMSAPADAEFHTVGELWRALHSGSHVEAHPQ
jgi:hypothetical protein